MKKQSFIYSDLSKKQLENLKELFVHKNIPDTEINLQKQRLELLERNNLNQEKKDMWDD